MNDDPKTTIHDARPGDIYADAEGKLWRVITTCREPTVTVEEVEPSGHTSYLAQQAPQAVYISQPGEFIRQRKEGGVTGLMWAGFVRIWRKPSDTAKQTDDERAARRMAGNYD